jgi:hypothetical protein
VGTVGAVKAHQRSKWAPILLATGTIAATIASTSLDVPVAGAATVNPSIDTGGVPGMVGLDAIYGGSGGGGDYDDFEWYDANGRLREPLFAPDRDPAGRALTQLRYEFYPKPTPTENEDTYDPYAVNVGGAHVEANGTQSIGTVRLPQIGDQNGGFRADGKVISSTPVADGRVGYDVFQVPYSYPDSGPPLPQTDTGASMAGFASSGSRGNTWSAGVTWPGMYTVFVADTATGRKVQAFTEIFAGRVPTIDLDATCFGFDLCTYLEGGPPTPTGGAFHSMSPVRILDTRTGQGISNGPISPGDGRIDEPNPIIRRDVAANHELKVTGLHGIPESGVSAVLLNVTAAQPTEPSFVSLYPKPPRFGDLYDDQASYRALPTTSNLNTQPFIDVPNMVVAPVGAGGKIRIYNFAGTSHLIADVAGWIDSSGNMQAGTGFTGVSPVRLLDTRTGFGGTGGTFSAGQERTLHVAGANGVPADATSVVLNVTGANAAGVGWAAAYPTGEARPTVSNINLSPGRTRANLAVVKVGKGGNVQLLVAETNADVIVDVYGYFSPSGGMVTPIAPQRVADTRGSRALGPFETRGFQVAGLAGIPAEATGVIMNVTAAAPSSDGYLTVWPSGTPRPTASNVNFTGGQDVPNLVMVRLGGGNVDIFNELGSTQVLLDVVGYVV